MAAEPTVVELERVNGLLWPKYDTECRKVAFDDTGGLTIAYAHVRDWRVVVQAGGNCGTWPRLLVERFGTVYTFEPDPVNFHCLVNNCPYGNVIKLQAGLGSGRESPSSLDRYVGNCGAHQLGDAGQYPVITIDSLKLQSCGLIYLDIEGFEPLALEGAEQTILRHRPVIGIEHKGLCRRYGLEPEYVIAQFERWGYAQVGSFSRDLIFAPVTIPGLP